MVSAEKVRLQKSCYEKKEIFEVKAPVTRFYTRPQSIIQRKSLAGPHLNEMFVLGEQM